MNPAYRAFTDELIRIKQAAPINKEELKDSAKEYLKKVVRFAPGAGLGAGTGWLFRKKVMPKLNLSPAQRSGLAMALGTLLGVGTAYTYGKYLPSGKKNDKT